MNFEYAVISAKSSNMRGTFITFSSSVTDKLNIKRVLLFHSRMTRKSFCAEELSTYVENRVWTLYKCMFQIPTLNEKSVVARVNDDNKNSLRHRSRLYHIDLRKD